MASKKSRRRLRKTVIERRAPPGAAPGTLIVDPQAPRPVIRLIAYGPDSITEQKIDDVELIPSLLGKWPVTWINIDGLGDVSIINRLGQIFGLHRLAMEDVINVHQRAKVEHYDNHYYITARMANIGAKLDTEQLSLFLGKNYVLTFQETEGDCFDPVRERIRTASGKARFSGPDYLAYTLLDAFIDYYFPVLEQYGERLEALEDEVILRPERQVISIIHQVKRDLLALRRAIWPLREALSSLVRETNPLISDETRIYLRDCYDHTIQIIDLLENFRDIASSLMEVYLSSVSNRLNEIMKVLTIFTAIFIPLNFIVGIYGMNFDPDKSPWNMPELHWRYGYPFALILMSIVALGLLGYFRRKGWFGASSIEGLQRSGEENSQR